MWSSLKNEFNVTSYKEIPAQDSDRAIQWFQAQIAMARPKIRRKAPDKWKESLYKPIYARAGELGISKDDLYLLAARAVGHQETDPIPEGTDAARSSAASSCYDV
jgi:hypothetical protein